MRAPITASTLAALGLGCTDVAVAPTDAGLADRPATVDAGDVVVAPADAGVPGDAPGCSAAARVEGPAPTFFWVGQSTEVASSTLAWEGAPCAGLSADADVPWLRATLPTASQLRIELVGAAVPGGVHRGRVRVREASGRVLAFADVELRALGTARAAASPKVLVVGIDGVRGDTMEGATLPNLRSLLTNAAYTYRASTHLTGATSSGPGWTSIFTGVGPDRHRVVANGSYAGRDTAWPSLFARAHDGLRLRTALASQWPDIVGGIVEPGAMDVRSSGNGLTVSNTMARWLRSAEYDVHFVHFDDVDHAGHASGFRLANPAYRGALEGVDALMRPLFDAIVERPDIANERWLVVVTTDHGGAGTNHGPMDADNQTIPLIVAGPTVVPRMPDGFVSHMDVHPTVMRFLGAPPPASWRLDSRPLGVAYETACGDSDDDDADGLTDCGDPDCRGLAGCAR